MFCPGDVICAAFGCIGVKRGRPWTCFARRGALGWGGGEGWRASVAPVGPKDGWIDFDLECFLNFRRAEIMDGLRAGLRL